MLHGIREGVLGYDKSERIVLANDFARQLLDLLPEFVGRPLREVLPPGRLADVVTGEIEGSDLLVLHGDRVLVANRMPIWHEGPAPPRLGGHLPGPDRIGGAEAAAG